MKTILLHGLGQTSSAWNKTVEAMDGNLDIFCPNLSDWLNGKDSCYPNLYQALEEYCERWNEPFHLCGLSLGGTLALQYCIEHPDKVNSLALIGTQYKMPKRLLQVQNMIFRILPNSAFQNMGFGKADFITLCNSMMNLDFESDLKRIRSHVLIICGDRDKANKAASSQLKELIPQSKLLIMDHAGHEVNIDHPAKLGKELNSFFKQQVSVS